MSAFFWTDGRLGWTFFALLLLTATCLLAADFRWRTRAERFSRLARRFGGIWLVAAALVIGLGWWL